MPAKILDMALAGRLTGLEKKDDGTRVISCGGIPRRLVGRAVCEMREEEIAAAAGPHQYGVGMKAGAEVLHKTLSAKSEEVPDHAFISLEAKNAFVTMNVVRSSEPSSDPVQIWRF